MHLILGPPGSGKTRLCLARMREALSARRDDCRLVVPTATMAEHLRNELAREGYVFRPDLVTTFTKLVQPWTSKLPGVPSGGLEIIVERSLQSLKLARYEEVKEFAGLRASIVHAIEEFSSAGGRLQDLEGVEPDFIRVYQTVIDELKRRNLHLRADQLRYAAEKIQLDGELMFTGFYSFTGPELNILHALASRTRLTVALADWPGARPSIDALSCGTVERLEPEPLPFNRTLCIAPTLDAEVSEIARRMAGAHANGRPWREMGVIVRSESTYVPALRSALGRFNIPSRLYFSSRLSDVPPVRFFRAVIDALIAGWDHELTVRALRMPGAPLESTPDGDRFEFEVLARVPGAGLDGLRGPAVIDELDTFTPWMTGKAYPRTWAERMRRLRSLFMARITDECTHEIALLWRSHAAAIDAFEEACTNAALMLEPATPIEFRPYWQVVETVLSASELRVPDHRRNVVHIIDAFEARQWKIPVVFVCGLLEKEFPKYQTEDPILPNVVRRRLQTKGIHLRTSDQRQEDERFLFDLALSRGRDAVVLSYPQLNAKGEANLASFFLQHAKPYVEERAADARPEPLRQRAPEPMPLISGNRMQAMHTRFTPTGIETFLQCPYQFFVQRSLRLQSPPEQPWERLSALVQGNIVHETLERSLRERRKVAEIFDDVFDKHCAEAYVPEGYRTEAIRLELLHNLELLETDGRLTRGVESKYEEPFDFTLADGTLIRGAVDRIEVDRNGNATVIDYKYRSKQSTDRTKKGHEERTAVQAGLYLHAVEKMGYRPTCMVYCGIKREIHLAGWNQPDELIAVMDQAREDTERAIAGIRQGIIAPQPADEAKCDFCEIANACRYEVAAMEQIKKAGS